MSRRRYVTRLRRVACNNNGLGKKGLAGNRLSDEEYGNKRASGSLSTFVVEECTKRIAAERIEVREISKEV